MSDAGPKSHGSFTPAEAASMRLVFRQVVAALRATHPMTELRKDRIAEIVCRLAADDFPLRADDGGYERRAMMIEATYRYLAASSEGRTPRGKITQTNPSSTTGT